MEATEEKKSVVIDPAVKRLLETVASLGGDYAVAKRMGKQAQLFYNMREGKSKFSLTTLQELATAFPGQVDANYVLFGVTVDEAMAGDVDYKIAPVYRNAPYALANGPKSDKASEDATDWKAQYHEINGKLNALTAQVGQLLKHIDFLEKLVKKLDPSFSSSSSQTTAHPCFNYTPAGFDYPGRPTTDAKEITHPATMALGGKVVPMPVFAEEVKQA